MLTILAVDVATTTGWACSDGTSGVEAFGAIRHGSRKVDAMPEPERHGCLGTRLAHWLEAKLNTTQAGVLLVERQMTHHRSHLLLGLRMVVLLAGWRRKMLVEEVWTAQWRPWALACGWWEKGDEADAKAMLGWWQANRLPLLELGQRPPRTAAVASAGPAACAPSRRASPSRA